MSLILHKFPSKSGREKGASLRESFATNTSAFDFGAGRDVIQDVSGLTNRAKGVCQGLGTSTEAPSGQCQFFPSPRPRFCKESDGKASEKRLRDI